MSKDENIRGYSESNPLMDTDSYKWSHSVQYPPGTTKMFSYVSPRGGKFKEVQFFGLQYILKNIRQIYSFDIEEAYTISKLHGVPFDKDKMMKIWKDHNGKFPIKIRAIPEGMRIPVGHPVMTVESTDPELFWLPGLLETQLMRVWYPSTVATISYEGKKIIKKYLEETADDLSGLPFKLHDFGSRGVSSKESAMIGGMAHLTNFMGTDTTVSLVGAMNYYNSDAIPGFSIPAMEHSTVTSWGRENEWKAYANMFNNFAKPGALIACVSDSYDIYHAVREIWGDKLKNMVISSGAILVVRPDSGDPIKVSNNIMYLLDEKFGSKVNSKGYKVLNNVRMIYGDGINLSMIEQILLTLKHHGYSADNIAFGMGGGLLQKCDRDTMKWAMKCSSVTIDGKQVDVYKDPITDAGKASLRGEIMTVRKVGFNRPNPLIVTERKDAPQSAWERVDDLMVDVWENGEFKKEWTFEEVRKNAEIV